MKGEQPRIKRPSKIKNLNALRILVVEDHLEMRTALEVLFRLLGCPARFAVDMASARQAAGEERFDVLLSDINLPDGSGWDLVRELKEKSCRTKVAISMSGSVTGKDAAASREAGFDFHLIKPFEAQELMAILERTADALTSPENAVAAAAPRRPKKNARLRPEDGAGAVYSYL